MDSVNLVIYSFFCYHFHGYIFLILEYELLEEKNYIEYFLLLPYGVCYIGLMVNTAQRELKG